MVADRYVKVVLTVIAIALAVIAVTPAIRLIVPGPAEAQPELTVPNAWGKLIAYSDGNLLLEAPDGSLRVVEIAGKPPEYPKTKAIVKRP
jgi:hypothetical protein